MCGQFKGLGSVLSIPDVDALRLLLVLPQLLLIVDADILMISFCLVPPPFPSADGKSRTSSHVSELRRWKAEVQVT
jgi:hypothetical protein